MKVIAILILTLVTMSVNGQDVSKEDVLDYIQMAECDSLRTTYSDICSLNLERMNMDPVSYFMDFPRLIGQSQADSLFLLYRGGGRLESNVGLGRWVKYGWAISEPLAGYRMIGIVVFDEIKRTGRVRMLLVIDEKGELVYCGTITCWRC